ncbi:MAG: hypothetical protein M3O46_05100 [Myxococcota bacterium]|nr:hypothetical protein [Myxococcota bacterium]
MTTSASAPLSDDEELLFRQVHPSFVRDGRPSSQAFRPTAKDEGKLSVARGSLTTAAGAFELHTAGLGLPSAGTWAVTVGECREQALSVLPDPLTSPPETVADPAHALVDFAPHSKSQGGAKGARLARKAGTRSAAPADRRAGTSC